ncbi:MAG: L-asparaginase 1 [Pseudomonadales bacterium]|nr:L-asparaginase 1 [Pseudomonadales bacterium]HCB44228.1 asparaginase [Pseudomonas sp.]|tara:strand:- start:9301 stop:10329 length:1029 start_codon:yes stop_codon:yes gene_type:complete
MTAEVLILHTGGTIGMVPGPNGLAPAPGLQQRIEQQLGSSLALLPSFDLLEISPLIDSADLTPGHWQQLAALLAERWDGYRGFIILHGTDTMAYSAAALSFMLGASERNVLFTGSQVPLGLPRSDAVAHLQAALQLAAGPRLGNVGLVFNNRLLNGSRLRKISSQQFQAFDTPNAAPLAELNIRPLLHHERLLGERVASRHPREAAALNFQPGAVAMLCLHPSMPTALYDAILADNNCKAVVLQSFGAGNIPSRDPAFNAFIKRAAARDKVVVNVTQCLQGGISPGAYAASAGLQEQGVLSGGDMTPEAAFCKLHWLLAGGRDTAAVVRDWSLNLSDERTLV